MTTIETVREIIHTYPELEEVADDANLFDAGADSLSFIEILIDLEDAFGIDISDAAAGPMLDTCDCSITKLAALVDQIRRDAGGAA